MRFKRTLVTVLTVGVFISSMPFSSVYTEVVHAEEVSASYETETMDAVSEGLADNADMEENPDRPEASGEERAVTGVDEYGQVYEIETESDGVVSDTDMHMYADSVYIVNFRADSSGNAVSGTTSYTEYSTGSSGYTNGAYGADAAYLGTTSDGKVKFMQSGVVGLVNASAVQVVSLSSVKSYSCYYADGTNIYHRICTDMTTSGWGASLNIGPQQSYMVTGTTYYSYDGHYFYTNYSTMLTDYKNDTRKNSVNPDDPYYNYFQYLPLRGISAYSAGQLSSIINSYASSSSKMYNMGAQFVNYQNTYGVNALLMVAIAANESSWGSSSIAMNKNNLFGLNAVDASASTSSNTFSSVSACIKDFAETYMSMRYLRAGYTYYNGGFLGDKASGINVSYASDPYWGEKAAAIAWSMDSKGGNQDRYYYTIGIKDTISTSKKTANLNVRTEATTSSTSVYKTGNKSNYAFIIWGTSSGFYKVQSDPVLNSARTSVNADSGIYSTTDMYLYASADYITIVSQGSATTPIATSTSTGSSSVSADTFAVRRGNAYYFRYALTTGTADAIVYYGKITDEVYVGDWDGDGMDTLCVRRGNTYYLKNSLSGGEADTVITYGKETDEVYVGDWDGDGVDTLCVRRGNTYYFKNSLRSGNADTVITYGKSTDEVYVGDWDGDGVDTLCVRRGKTYYFKNNLGSGNADTVIAYGKSTDSVLVGDWDADGLDTLCVRRGNVYYLKNSLGGGDADNVIAYGKTTDAVYVGTWR